MQLPKTVLTELFASEDSFSDTLIQLTYCEEDRNESGGEIKK